MSYETVNPVKVAWTWTKIISSITLLILGMIMLGMWGCPNYSVYQQTLEGKAELAKATQNRQIKVQEAMAKFESAIYDKQSDSTRAVGVSIANHIIGQSLRDNEAYLRWLWITDVAGKDVEKTTVYIPTEANIPIMEAGRNARTIVNLPEKETKK